MLKAAAAERNKGPILEVLKKHINQCLPLTALEIASGCGTHVSHFSQYFKNVTWQPTDVDQQCLSSIKAHIDSEGLINVNEPVYVDVSSPLSSWPTEIASKKFDLILCSNMIHISPWKCTVGLFEAAGSLISPHGFLVTYGPYAVNGVLTPQSNVDFDQSLRRRDPEWGIRDVKDLENLAKENGLLLVDINDMPANNKTLVFKKSKA